MDEQHQSKSAWIFSHGQLSVVPPEVPGVLVIAADGGARHLLQAGRIPHIALGDFDSLTQTDLDFLRQRGCRIIRHSPEKDKTDTQLAVELALGEGRTDICIFGGLGSRFDHTLGNIHLLLRIHEAGGTGIVTDGGQAVRLLTREMTVAGNPGDIITILPLTPVLRGLTVTGLKYPLHRADLLMGDTRTISNEVLTGTGKVTLDSGMALFIQVPADRS